MRKKLDYYFDEEGLPIDVIHGNQKNTILLASIKIDVIHRYVPIHLRAVVLVCRMEKSLGKHQGNYLMGILLLGKVLSV